MTVVTRKRPILQLPVLEDSVNRKFFVMRPSKNYFHVPRCCFMFVEFYEKHKRKKEQTERKFGTKQYTYLHGEAWHEQFFFRLEQKIYIRTYTHTHTRVLKLKIFLFRLSFVFNSFLEIHPPLYQTYFREKKNKAKDKKKQYIILRKTN